MTNQKIYTKTLLTKISIKQYGMKKNRLKIARKKIGGAMEDGGNGAVLCSFFLTTAAVTSAEDCLLSSPISILNLYQSQPLPHIKKSSHHKKSMMEKENTSVQLYCLLVEAVQSMWKQRYCTAPTWWHYSDSMMEFKEHFTSTVLPPCEGSTVTPWGRKRNLRSFFLFYIRSCTRYTATSAYFREQRKKVTCTAEKNKWSSCSRSEKKVYWDFSWKAPVHFKRICGWWLIYVFVMIHNCLYMGSYFHSH